MAMARSRGLARDRIDRRMASDEELNVAFYSSCKQSAVKMTANLRRGVNGM
jgi:hypothetical protein